MVTLYDEQIYFQLQTQNTNLHGGLRPRSDLLGHVKNIYFNKDELFSNMFNQKCP